MAKSDGAGTPTGQKRSLLLLLREAGDALEAAAPPFDAAAGAARLRKAAWVQGLLQPDDTPAKHLAVTGANLEVEAPPFDVDAGAARLREAAHARGLLSGSALEASEEAASRRLNLRVHDRDALDEIELYADVLIAAAAVDRSLTAAELDKALGISEGPGATVPTREEKSPSSPASRPRPTREDRLSDSPEYRHAGTARTGMDPRHVPPCPGSQTDARFLTVAAVALMMGVSKMTVYQLVHHGKLDAIRLGRSFRIPEQAVLAYMAGESVQQRPF